MALCVDPFLLQVLYTIKFGQIYLSRPILQEADGTKDNMFPQQARLRNLTYDDVYFVWRYGIEGNREMLQEIVPHVHALVRYSSNVFMDINCVLDDGENEPLEEEHKQILIGKV